MSLSEHSAPPCPDEEPERHKWQKRAPMPAVKPRPRRREQAITLAQLVDAAGKQLEQLRRQGKAS